MHDCERHGVDASSHLVLEPPAAPPLLTPGLARVLARMLTKAARIGLEYWYASQQLQGGVRREAGGLRHLFLTVARLRALSTGGLPVPARTSAQLTAAQRMLAPHELAAFLGIPLRTVYRWRSRGEGPRGYRIGRHVRYRLDDIERWLDDRSDEIEPGRALPTRERTPRASQEE